MERNQLFHDMMWAAMDDKSLPEEERKLSREFFEQIYHQLESDGTFDQIDEDIDRLFAQRNRNVVLRIVK